jgi:hypothetical protein
VTPLDRAHEPRASFPLADMIEHRRRSPEGADRVRDTLGNLITQYGFYYVINKTDSCRDSVRLLKPLWILR